MKEGMRSRKSAAAFCSLSSVNSLGISFGLSCRLRCGVELMHEVLGCRFRTGRASASLGSHRCMLDSGLKSL